MPRFRFSLPVAALSVLLAVLGGVHLRNALMLGEILFDSRRMPALPPVRVSPRDLTLNRVDEAGRQLGLRQGDRVLAMEGQPVTSLAQLGRTWFARPAGEPAVFRLQRDAEPPFEVTLRREAVGKTGFNWQQITSTLALAVGLPTVCLGLGFFVAFRRPRDPVAWALLFFLYGLGKLSVSFNSHRLGFSPLFSIPDTFIDSFRVAMFPVAAMWFGLLFPDPRSPHKLLPWLRWPITIIALGTMVPFSLALTGQWHAPAWFNAWVAWHESWIDEWFNWLMLGAVALGAANLVYKMIRERQPAARRRMKLLVAGIGGGVGPLAFLLAWGTWRGRDAMVFGEAALIAAVLALLLVPVTLAHVVLVQRAMDVGVAMRQGLRHALAARGASVLGSLLAAAIVTPAALYSFRRDVPDGWRVLALVAVGAVILIERRGTKRLREWVDRRYFREAVDSERMLAELSGEVHRFADSRTLLETVAGRIAETLHVPRVAALLEESSGGYAPAWAHGYGPPGLAVQFGPDSPAVERLRRTRAPQTCYLDDPEHWVHREAAADGGRLRDLQTEVLLPITARERLLGFFSLGPKQSELPYSRGDLRLLQALASQTGLALENTRLAGAIAEEAAQRERLHRELEIAAEVQERLLPKRAPKVPGLELAGRCLPAQTIGGDCFDFLETPGGEIGLAIADVAGKGIPASLLMAGMQASLRSLTLAGSMDLAELMTKLNRLVYEGSPANRFITFFYGLYDPRTGRLRYGCAGHNPALLVRGGGQVEWLRAKGVGLGLSPRARYETGETILAPGDRLVLYTDGVPEARNAAGDEYGEERLVAAALAEPEAGALVERVIGEAAAFAGDAPRHDDITVIAARVALDAPERL